MAAEIAQFPLPFTTDWAEIQAGRKRARRAYADATTPAEKGRALIWINHWRALHEYTQALREVGIL